MIILFITLMMSFGTFAFGYVAHDAYKVDEKGILYAMVGSIVVINGIGLEMIIVECL